MTREQEWEALEEGFLKRWSTAGDDVTQHCSFPDANGV